MEIQAPVAPMDDPELYPLHEEDDVPEITPHKEKTTYLYDALRARFSDCHVGGNNCIYWERDNMERYRAPDVFVVREKPFDPKLRVYLCWQEPPVSFVAEVGSRSTFRVDEGPKQDIYAQLIRAKEYLYSNPPEGVLRLWRMGPQGYEEVAPGANGRVRSVELDLEFGLDQDGWLWIYTLDGERLRTHLEAEREREEAQRGRAAAEARVAAEAQRRQEAEARAAEERQRREEAERQLAELQARFKQGED